MVSVIFCPNLKNICCFDFKVQKFSSKKFFISGIYRCRVFCLQQMPKNYTKLNRLLIACFASATNDYNTYDTRNFWTGSTKSLATKNNYREVEFYDKQDESQRKSPYFSRLEFRSLRMRGDIETEFLIIWFDRLDRAVQEFENVQNKFNQYMAEVYLNDLKKKKHERQFLSINSFLMTRKDYIFTSRQMKNLLMLIGQIKNRHKIKPITSKNIIKLSILKKKIWWQ